MYLWPSDTSHSSGDSSSQTLAVCTTGHCSMARTHSWNMEREQRERERVEKERQREERAREREERAREENRTQREAQKQYGLKQ